ncbi:hypothetical protein PsYK624_068600 [Phanerochaete sordida]|uniref:FAS1 domain-containing protein n=1 Tax=Phanerochaete sordida TaxID=48140 RepID=A0A9P3LCP8_9APHY|nr:hypothetical protein PsYK624_068600 [Phanerochaete sordida]
MSNGPGSHPEQVPPPVAVDPSLLDYLNNTLGLTAYAAALHAVATEIQAIVLPAALRSASSVPSTIWAPTDSAFTNAAANARGYTFNASDPHFLAALIAYHTVPESMLTAYGPAAFHSLIPTSLTNAFEGWTNLENGKPQVLPVQLTQAGADAPIWFDQTNTPNTLRSVAYSQDITVVMIDQVLGMPSHSFEGYNGFTAFAPAGAPGLLEQAQKRFSSQQDLLSLFNNHVVYGKTIYSSNFTSETPFTSQSGFNYLFSSSQDGNWSVALNGITTSILTADVLVANGVIHVLDDALWNLTPGGGQTQASPATPSPTEGSQAHSEPATSMSPAAIAGLAIAAAAVVSLCVAVTYIMRRHYRSRGVRVLSPEEGIDGPLTPPGQHTPPSQSAVDVREAGRPVRRGVYQGSPSSTSPGHWPGVKAVVLEKHAYTHSRNALDITPSSIDSPEQRTQPLPVTEDVVEHLLHALVQRIDRNDSAASQRHAHRSQPPEYRSTES